MRGQWGCTHYAIDIYNIYDYDYDFIFTMCTNVHQMRIMYTISDT